jgi:hypothetical protein
MSTLLDHPRLVLAAAIILLWLFGELGAYWSKHWSPPQDDGRADLDVVLGASLTLLALIIGFSFSMAISRYDQRKNYEEGEANAIGTEYLRADLLSSADAERARRALTQYTEQRILFYQADNIDEIEARTAQLQSELWSIVRSAAAAQPTPIVALATAGMNDVLNSQGYTEAAWRNRLPVAGWLLMVVIATCCCALMGYNARRGQPQFIAILPLVLSIAFFLIADIDSPRHGMIRVVPENLIALARFLQGQ